MRPSTAKLQFFRQYSDTYIRHVHVLEPRIAGIETVEPPTDGPIVAYARRDFGIPGRLLGTDRALRAAAR